MQTTGLSQVAMMQLDSGKSTGAEAEAHEKSDQILLLLEGELKGEIDGAAVKLKRGDFLVIPAGVKHRFSNEGTDEAVTFNVYAPPAYPADAKG